MKPKGLLLINLGTPESPDPKSVGAYLREFLMDPWVIDIPKPVRWILVQLLIVPKRSRDSAKLYQKVWTEQGSPLLVHTLNLEKKVQAFLGERYQVKAAMRYGKPNLKSAIEAFKKAGTEDVLVVPLYPQYSLAATESSIQKTRDLFHEHYPQCKFDFITEFFNRSEYLDATAEITQHHLKQHQWDKVLFSFHGLPERQVKKTDSTGEHCLKGPHCCDQIVTANRNCYRAQSYATVRELVQRLQLAPGQYDVGFQSRLKGAPWIRPFSDEFYRNLPRQGVKRLAVVCPSFVADCLETLEEVRMRGKEEFIENGGEDLVLIPSLNSEEAWVKGLSQLVLNHQPKT